MINPNIATVCELLVSVRDLSEMQIAMAGGVEIVDFKDPSLGPLAPVSPDIWLQAVEKVSTISESTDGGVPPVAQQPVVAQQPANPELSREPAATSAMPPKLSAALGEGETGIAAAGQLPPAFDFAKIGTSGVRSRADLQAIWRQTRANLASEVELVAVAYADYEAAGSIAPTEVFCLAAALGFSRCLIDTFTKDGRSALDYLDLDRRNEIDEISRQRDLWWALGGSIQLGHARQICDEGIVPSCFAVRGDVCSGDRTGSLDAGRVQQWAAFTQSLRSQDFGGIDGVSQTHSGK